MTLLTTLLLSSVAFASECYRSELDPQTNKIFASSEVYQAAVSNWQTREPENPGLWKLAKAYSIYRQERDFANSLGYDKLAHCYVGCRISQGTNYRVAEYVGWLKEDQDIRDCKKGTRFEENDFIATLEGAHIGQSQKDALGCRASCELRYVK